MHIDAKPRQRSIKNIQGQHTRTQGRGSRKGGAEGTGEHNWHGREKQVQEDITTQEQVKQTTQPQGLHTDISLHTHTRISHIYQ